MKVTCPRCKVKSNFSGGEIIQPCPNCRTQLRVDLREVLVVPDYTPDCPCPKTECSYRNKCRECHEMHHNKNGSLPKCFDVRIDELR